MTTREEFKKRVIELIHGLPYEEAIKKEIKGLDFFLKLVEEDGKKSYKTPFAVFKNHGGKITIGRVMQVIGDRPNLQFYLRNYGFGDLYIECWEQIEDYSPTMVFKWKLTKDGQECTDDDQSDETIEKLLNLLK